MSGVQTPDPQRVSSYDETAPRPRVGTRWVWEPKSAAIELVEVTQVLWNGEEWWVRTAHPRSIGCTPASEPRGVFNDLGRFWEAARPIAERVAFHGQSIRRGKPTSLEAPDA